MTSAIALSASLIQRRNDLRTLLGEKYEPAVKAYRLAIRNCAKCWDSSLADTALRIAEDMHAAGHDPNLVFAALVDESEAGR